MSRKALKDMWLRNTTRNSGRRTRSSAAARARPILGLEVAFRCIILGKISQICLPVKLDRQIPKRYRAIAAFAGLGIAAAASVLDCRAHGESDLSQIKCARDRSIQT